LAFLSEEEGETLVDEDLRDDHVKGVRPQEGGRQPYGILKAYHQRIDKKSSYCTFRGLGGKLKVCLEHWTGVIEVFRKNKKGGVLSSQIT
jgi:hypothetical protein